MRKQIVPATIAILVCCSILLCSFLAFAAPPGKWVEARSPDFIVVSNAGEGQARKTAVQFEQIRSLFRDSLPYVKVHPSPVITIFAVKDADSLRRLLPEYWAEKNHAHPGGIFINRFDSFQVAVNLSAQENYEAVYHEYYHSVTVPFMPGLPTWMAEGLADFYGNAELEDKTANIGLANTTLISELRQNQLIPLDVLFKVDHSSPYYNEQNKVSIFYAESWALVHYFMLGDNGAHHAQFSAYVNALNQGATQDEAIKTFGDLGKLQQDLRAYVNGMTFYAMHLPAPEKVADGDIHIRPLSAADVDAYFGGFLVLHDQLKDADPLLKEAVQLDPKLALAEQNLALLHLARKENYDAVAALSVAISLNPTDPSTRYLRAVLDYSSSPGNPQVEEDLRQALEVKPDFANANGLLAIFLAANDAKLTEALDLAQKAAAQEPGSPTFQLTLASVLARMKRYDEAEKAARRVQAIANDSAMRDQATEFLNYVSQARANDAMVRQRQEAAAARATESTSVTTSGDSSAPDGQQPVLRRRDEPPSTQGLIAKLTCTGNVMQLTLTPDDGSALLVFHAKDLTRLIYNSAVSDLKGDFTPCTDLKGRTVKLTYAKTDSKTIAGELVQIEITK